MRALMCKDPTGLFDTLLRFFFSFLLPSLSLHIDALVALWALGTDPKALRISQGSLPPQQSGNIWPPDYFVLRFLLTP